MKEQILEKIREVCNLKELRFGCEVKEKYFDKVTKHTLTTHYRGGVAENYWNTIEGEKVNVEDIIEIIGLPVELNHLLIAFDQRGYLNNPFAVKGNMVLPITYRGEIYHYDLTKSVSENLDNPELCSLVAELLGINPTT